MISYVLFDLDGTLLPMDNDEFVNGYFKLLAKKLIPHGYEPDSLIKAIWQGTGAMVENDGHCTNEEAFWEKFSSILGEKVLQDKPLFEEFYKNEFQQAKALCGFDEKANQSVQLVKELGLKAVLATNPLFPAVATESRIQWAGLNKDDFELYTTYEDINYCKPNLDYYREVVKRLGGKEEECIMVGNNVAEDMIAEQLGMKVFLLSDNLINKYGDDISNYPQGGFKEFMDYLKETVDKENR